MAVKTDSKLNWYPVRVFYGRAEALKKSLDEGNIEYFYPMHLVEKETNAGLKYVEEPLVRSLIFIKSTLKALLDLKTRYNSSLTQMELFIKLCGMKEAGLEYLGEDEPKYHVGDKVRVTDGIFKGFEGHIKRIRHDRKLIVTIEGVAAFATRFIPPSMLEKVK